MLDVDLKAGSAPRDRKFPTAGRIFRGTRRGEASWRNSSAKILRVRAAKGSCTGIVSQQITLQYIVRSCRAESRHPEKLRRPKILDSARNDVHQLAVDRNSTSVAPYV